MAAWLCCLLATCTGCDDGRESILVSLCGDLAVPGEVDALRVSILDDARVERHSGVIELVQCPADRLETLPVETELPPVKGSVWVVVQALKDGVEVARFEKRSQTDETGGAVVRLVLTTDCMGYSCPLGQTCIAGACVLTPWEGQEKEGERPACPSPPSATEDVVSAPDDVVSDAPLYCPTEGGQGGARAR